MNGAMNWASLMKTAEQATRQAGEALLAAESSWREVHFADDKDVKIRADREAETILREALRQAGNYPVIGEEMGGDADLLVQDTPYWIVDPLDGTFNFTRGVPIYCVSVGLWRGMTPLLGAIYDFTRDELFSGAVAGGFYINGVRWPSKWAASVQQAVLQSGFPTGRDFGEQALADFLRRVQKYKKVRAIGSAALATAWVAAGRCDVYFEEGIRLWDIAAGLALIQAAGGVVRMVPSVTGLPMSYDVWAGGRLDLLG